MDDQSTHITHDFPPFFRVHNTGRVERYIEYEFVPPSKDLQNGVVSKDVVISPENHVTARIYLPQSNQKLPLIIYAHGGAFSTGSAFSSLYHNYVNSLAAESKSVVVSVEYRLAPEHPLPTCYEDCWMATKWVESHSRVGHGLDPWLNNFVDFNRVFLAGDSAGANIAHEMVVRAGVEEGFGIKFAGLILIHPFFGSGESNRLWDFICSETTGVDDPRLNPAAHMGLLSNLGCNRVMVCVAERDFLKDRGGRYYEALKRSGWKGAFEFFETRGEDHVFHLFDLGRENAVCLMRQVVDFMNSEIVHSVR